MKKRTLLLVVFILFLQIGGLAKAQDSLLYERGGAYLRFDSAPIKICQVTPDPLWAYMTQVGVEFLDDYISIEFNQNFNSGEGTLQAYYPDCDIEILLVGTFEFLPECYSHGEAPLGCTMLYITDEGRYISYVYILRDTVYRSPVWYHEILHALGIVGHSTNPSDIMYARVQYDVLEPTSDELGLLVWLYAQPAIDWTTTAWYNETKSGKAG